MQQLPCLNRSIKSSAPFLLQNFIALMINSLLKLQANRKECFKETFKMGGPFYFLQYIYSKVVTTWFFKKVPNWSTAMGRLRKVCDHGGGGRQAHPYYNFLLISILSSMHAISNFDIELKCFHLLDPKESKGKNIFGPYLSPLYCCFQAINLIDIFLESPCGTMHLAVHFGDGILWPVPFAANHIILCPDTQNITFHSLNVY